METRADTRSDDGAARDGGAAPAPDDLAAYLASLDRDSCWRVDHVYRRGRLETTERVFFRGANGAELGPFVRKRIARDSGLGGAYETLAAAQRLGVRLAHVPRVVDCHRTDDALVVVMEHVPGETLGACVGRLADAPARLDLVRRAFPELCDAVSELHERLRPPVIHRDLKPGNVIVRLPADGGPASVTLIDLGIARTFKEGAQQDTVRFGTRAYAPPEQFGFGQTSPESDVYALGMLLFFCLTGREPAPADRRAGFADPDVPDALRAVVAHATELDPAARYGSARELKVAFLGALAASETTSAVLPEPAPTLSPEPAPPASSAATAGQAPVPPETFTYPRASRQVGSGIAELLGRVPGWAGVVWDVIVLGLAFVLVVGCVTAVIDPTPQNASWPVWYLLWSYLGFLVPEIVVGAYLLLDRRPVRRSIPPLANLTVARETRVGLTAMLVLLAAWIVATAVMQG